MERVTSLQRGPELSLDEPAECVMAVLGSWRSLQQICRAADGLLQLADDPGQGSAAHLVPVVDV